MNEKLDQLQQRLDEISKLSLEEQTDAFAQLHRELEEELNPADSPRDE